MVPSARTIAVPIVLGLAVLLVGCLRPRNTPNNDLRRLTIESGFDDESLRGKVVAVAGVVLDDGMRLDEFCGLDLDGSRHDHLLQADLLSPTLESRLHARDADVHWQRWRTVSADVPQDRLLDGLGSVARGGTLRGRRSKLWAEHLPMSDYLLVTRVEGTITDGTGQSDWSRTGQMGRTVVVWLDLVDLASGTPVWTVSLQSHEQAPGGPPPDTRRSLGTTVQAPTLAEALVRAYDTALDHLDLPNP